MRGEYRRSLHGLLVLGAVALTACGDDLPPSLLVVIDSDLEVPTKLATIEVTLTASSTDEGLLCEPMSHRFELDESSRLPLHVYLERGEVFTAWLVLRVDGQTTGGLIRREYRGRWPTTGVEELAVELPAICYNVSCGENEMCVDGQCHGVPVPDVFDDDFLQRDVGESCDLEDLGNEE